LSAVSGAAFAQSSVTLGGIVDLGYSTAAVKVDGDTVAKSKGMSDGVQNGGRLFFKAVEDLGGGLKASANLEYSITPATKAQTFDSRQSYVDLTGGFGSFRMGRQYTVHHNNQGAGDMLGNFSNAGYLGSMDSLVRADNALVYISPSFNGFTVAGEVVTDPSVAAPGADKATGSGVSVSYAAGALAAGYAHETLKNGAFDAAKLLGANRDADLAIAAYDKRTANSLMASYDFGVAKVGFVNNNTKYDTVKFKANTLSVKAPMGSVTLLASIGSGKITEGADSVKLSAYQIGAQYALSKNTNLYAITGQTKYKEAAIKFNQTSVGVKFGF
jgi:predicted porin